MERENWLSPMNKVILIKAFRSKADLVTLRDGRKFTITYEDDNKVFVRPAGSDFAPAGRFDLKQVTDSLWITESVEASGTRERIYITLLDEFLKSKEAGVDVVDYWPNLKDKLPTTIQQGFSKAKSERGKHADAVRVMTQESRVYLLRENDGE